MFAVSDFVQEILTAGVHTVIDVRESAWSRRSEYTQARLSNALSAAGIEYVHARFAGNPKRLRSSASSHSECLRMYDEYLSATPEVIEQFDMLVTPLLKSGKPVCLVCYERHPQDCHRSVLLRRWQDLTGGEAEIQHLATEGAPRLTVNRTTMAAEDASGHPS